MKSGFCIIELVVSLLLVAVTALLIACCFQAASAWYAETKQLMEMTDRLVANLEQTTENTATSGDVVISTRVLAPQCIHIQPENGDISLQGLERVQLVSASMTWTTVRGQVRMLEYVTVRSAGP